jgi:hypothetical protein
VDQVGREVFSGEIKKQDTAPTQHSIDIPLPPAGIYVVAVWQGNTVIAREKILFY